MNRKYFPVLLALGLLSALLLINGCDKGDTGDQADAAAANTPAPALSNVPGAREGVTVPDFTLKKVGGGTLELSSLRGKAVLIDFWDTWCPPCRAAMPHLEEISNTYADDLVIVGIAFGRQGEAAVAKFIKDQGLTFEFVMADQKIIIDYGGLQSIPTTFLVDRNGLVVKKCVGGQSKSSYENAVKAVLES